MAEPAEETFRALVVDDSAVIRELIAVNLELEGFLVTCASDGESALRAVREVVPHVITLDVMMPRLDGIATVRALREDPATSDIPIVIVSGRSTPADIERGREAGADRYVTKPFEPSELVEACRDLASRGRPNPV
ncbi:MAG TPA: response regulator [Nocardioidaceae bacterium]|nr:response regulator [Nocardioidaceae bacterium]